MTLKSESEAEEDENDDTAYFVTEYTEHWLTNLSIIHSTESATECRGPTDQMRFLFDFWDV